jgi:hypothetical protein
MRRRTATTIGLVALLLIDVALVALAFRNPFRGELTRAASGSPVATATAPATVPTGVSTGAPTSGPTGRATSSSTGSPTTLPSTDIGSAVTIVPVDGSTAWRFTSGSCRTGGATLALTTNGGTTWKSVESPLAMLARVQASDTERVVLLGAQSDCRLTTQRSGDAGLTWAPGGSPQMWFRDPQQAAEVTNSNGRVATPCGRAGSVASLVAVSAGAALALCEDGKTVETADAGATWVETGRGLVALAIDAQVVSGRLAATVAGVSDNCDGLAITTISSGASTRVGCVDVGIDLGPQLRGRISLASAGDHWWLAIGADTFTSANAGKAWNRV